MRLLRPDHLANVKPLRTTPATGIYLQFRAQFHTLVAATWARVRADIARQRHPAVQHYLEQEQPPAKNGDKSHSKTTGDDLFEMLALQHAAFPALSRPRTWGELIRRQTEWEYLFVKGWLAQQPVRNTD